MAHIIERGVVGWFTFAKFYASMVERFPAGSRFVEIGVYQGASFGYLAEKVAASGKKIELFAVDNFGFPDTEKQFYAHMAQYPVPFQMIKGNSWESARLFEDRSIDFAFLDADHVFESLRADIRAWLPKIADGGVLGGHDIGPEIKPDHPGVRPAVRGEFGDRFHTDLDEDVWWIESSEIREKS